MHRIHHLIDGKDPATLAIIDHDETRLSYEELRGAVREAARMLRAHGVRPGDRVVVLAENCATYAAVVLALSDLDAWIVPLNARATEQEVDTVIAHSGARCVICTSDESDAARAHAQRLGAVSSGQLSCGSLVISPLREETPEPVEAGAGQVAAILYTSGTSGAPKGVMLTHDNLLFTANASKQRRQATAADQSLVVLPGTHIFGFSSIILTTLLAGGCLRFQPRFDPAQVIAGLHSGATMLSGVPQMFALILKHCKDKGIDRVDSGLRYLSSGGSPLDPSWKRRVERIFGCPIHNGYGLTEGSPGIATTQPENPPQDDSVGPALPGIDVRLDNPGADGVGELLARGRNIMKGYYRNPEATAQAFTPDGFLRTGDLARIEEDGRIYIVGRCKEVIIHSGFNVYPPEIEAALNAHPSVTQAAVVGRARDGNEDVLAFVTLRVPATVAELKAHLGETLVRYKIPHHIVVTDALPEAATGKILKHKLVQAFAPELAQLDQEAKNA
ncbi:class I adenylate-forming enzyme family protein [Ruegeria lacuscaerulensis]|uniref:class I adenylate-forming enzyme family protein n=1 Tax=Ruegeria lacuscaerulensis TaxID=55218 RepID=UPI001BE3EFB1|nr:AMP-binding protein [Ruegeria lacuscaerulensis]